MNTNIQLIISHLFFSEELNEWVVQSNTEHSNGVAELASEFADQFGMGNYGQLLGLLHDRGKERMSFQLHIKKTSGYDLNVGHYENKDHSYVGALILEKRLQEPTHMFSNIIAGHHRGLYDIDELELILKKALPEEVNFSFPPIFLPPPPMRMENNDFSHLGRMLFSCLTDADYLDTERFMKPKDFVARRQISTMESLKGRLDKWLSKFDMSPATPLNKLRSEIQSQCKESSGLQPGFFELTVPTGGGKTISSMVWAISHALKYGKKRIIVAIPYTSIITQTAEVLREIFGEENVLEHHSVVDESKIFHKNKLSSENWDAPIVVTTNVQLFESMFSNRPSKCRKLHSLCDSVLILDEVQCLPLSFLQPIVNSLKTYVKLFNMSVLLCTASQPVLTGERKGDGMAKFYGLTERIRPLIPKEMELHNKLRRVNILLPRNGKRINLEKLADSLTSHKKVLCIVNTRKIAAELFALLPQDGLKIHLSRMMCSAHINKTIEKIKDLLINDPEIPVRVISTQLIEAGVDIDFPVVFRQLAGLDSILQAAGRCNREGKNEIGDTHVFELADFKPLGMMGSAINAMKQMISLSSDRDWFSPETMAEYFEILYNKTPTFDKENIDSISSNPKNILYETIANKFRLIDESGVPVIVNYGEASHLVSLLHRNGPSRSLVKKLGLYSVSVKRRQFKQFLSDGLLEEPWEGFYFLPLQGQYDEEIGLKVDNEYLEQIFVV